eukprot:gene12109-14165_t
MVAKQAKKVTTGTSAVAKKRMPIPTAANAYIIKTKPFVDPNLKPILKEKKQKDADALTAGGRLNNIMPAKPSPKPSTVATTTTTTTTPALTPLPKLNFEEVSTTTTTTTTSTTTTNNSKQQSPDTSVAAAVSTKPVSATKNLKKSKKDVEMTDVVAVEPTQVVAPVVSTPTPTPKPAASKKGSNSQQKKEEEEESKKTVEKKSNKKEVAAAPVVVEAPKKKEAASKKKEVAEKKKEEVVVAAPVVSVEEKKSKKVAPQEKKSTKKEEKKIAGFNILELVIPGTPIKKYIYYKKEVNKKWPVGRTMFITSLPVGCTTLLSVQQLLQSTEIESVHFDNKPTNDDQQQEEETLDSVPAPATTETSNTNCAHVVMTSADSLQSLMQDLSKIELTLPAIESDGLANMVKEFESNYITNYDELQVKLDQMMMDYDKRMLEQKLEKKAMAGVPDDDGFVLVTGSNKNTKPITLEEIRAREEAKKTKNFYTFQQRQQKKQELDNLRKKFEEDKQKISKMSSARKFKPY